MRGPAFEQNLNPFNQGCFVPCLVQIGRVLLEKIFKIFSILAYILAIIFTWKRAWPYIRQNWNQFHPRMLCAKFSWNLPSGSGDDVENVKSLQLDRRTDRRQTKDYQKISLELSAQVSLYYKYQLSKKANLFRLKKLIIWIYITCDLNDQKG